MKKCKLLSFLDKLQNQEDSEEAFLKTLDNLTKVLKKNNTEDITRSNNPNNFISDDDYSKICNLFNSVIKEKNS